MAQVLNLRSPTPILQPPSSCRPDPYRIRASTSTRHRQGFYSWTSLQQNLKCTGRFSCLFSNNGKQEQARKALESALGGKKTEFEKWDKEIKKREEAGGGGDSGGGGWFRWFGGSNDDNFWQEAQQAGLTILGIIVMYLIIAKGDVILAVFFNPLLFALRGTRNGLTFVTSKILRTVSPSTRSKFDSIPREENYTPVSAKESVVRKWGSD